MTNNGLLSYMHSTGALGDHFPKHQQLLFETVAGSYARGVARPDSDIDVVGIYAPLYNDLYPVTVPGFGSKVDAFKGAQISRCVDVPHLGEVTIDAQAFDVVHFFNLLLKGSPNHVEYLFFDPMFQDTSNAGDYLLQVRNRFVNGRFVERSIAAGFSILNKGNATNKQCALAHRFFSYACQAMLKKRLFPELITKTNNMLLTVQREVAEAIAYSVGEHASSLEERMEPSQDVDEEAVNIILLKLLRLQWTERSDG